MKRQKTSLIGMLLILALVLEACSGIGNTAAVEPAPETVQEAPAEPTPTPTPEPEPEEEEAPEAPEDDLTDVLYADEFTPAAWADFGSEEKSGEHGDDLICVRGTIGDYDDDKHTLTLKAADGDWTVNCGQALSYAFNEMMVDLRGEEMRVFGTYAGFSQSSETPRISFIKGVPELPCRMESIDGETRITYLDSVWENLRADKDYAIGHLTWKGVSDWETGNSVDEVGERKIADISYTPVEDYPARIRVYYEELPDDMKDWKKADDILEEVLDSYFGEDEIVSTKSATVAGLEGRRVTAAIEIDGVDYTMNADTYVLLDTDAYYTIMFAEPYFNGSMMNKYAEEFLESVEYSETEAAFDGGEEDKKEEETKTESAKPENNDKTGTSNKPDTTEKTDTTGSSSSNNKKKTEFPKYNDILCQYDVTLNYSWTDKTTGEELKDGYSYRGIIEASNLVSYDEETGLAMCLRGDVKGDGDIPLYFSYTDDGRIQYSATYEGTAPDGDYLYVKEYGISD